MKVKTATMKTMGNKILSYILGSNSILAAIIFFMYKGSGWPLGRESLEAIVAFGVFVLTFLSFRIYLNKRRQVKAVQQQSIVVGLVTGLLWTIEISMNNILRPGLPSRDIYDDIFWILVAIVIFISSLYFSFKTKKINQGIVSGFWSGLASGAVASFTALIFIVFGMSQILLDPLNQIEWSAIGTSSGAPNMAVYFAYQTLAGAVLHLLILGALMGLFLGLLGSILGKILRSVLRQELKL